MKRTVTFILVLSLTFYSSLRADEGMWLLHLLKKLNIEKMNEMGCKLTAEDIYSINNASIKDAIVSIGGCRLNLLKLFLPGFW